LVAYELARVFARQGHEVTLVSDVGESERHATENLQFVEIESALQRFVSRLPGGFATWLLQHLIGNVSAVLTVCRLTRQRSFDVVHAHGNLSAILLSILCDLPLVYTEHDAPPWQCRYRRRWERVTRKTIYRALNVTAFRRADHVVATFESLGHEIVGRWGVREERVTAILNGAAETFTNGSGDPGSNGSGPSSLNAPVCEFDHYCLFVGRLTQRKCPDLLVKALAEAEDDICCVFAGDGPMRKQIELLAERLGVADRVAFLGNVSPSKLAPLYCNAELLILPTVSDTSPLVVTEAMACGTPVLATRVAGLPSLVEDWETGFLVHPDNVGELTVALRFLMHDPELRRTMSVKARMRVAERFLWSRVSDQYEGVYQSVALAVPVLASSGRRRALRRTQLESSELEPFFHQRSPRRFDKSREARRFRRGDHTRDPVRGNGQRGHLHV
jgi:glycosyltransferase involved in cell wall biosynthesis